MLGQDSTYKTFRRLTLVLGMNLGPIRPWMLLAGKSPVGVSSSPTVNLGLLTASSLSNAWNGRSNQINPGNLEAECVRGRVWTGYNCINKLKNPWKWSKNKRLLLLQKAGTLSIFSSYCLSPGRLLSISWFYPPVRWELVHGIIK